MLEPGTKVPDFTLSDHDGNSVRLSQYRGQILVLYVYPKADAPGC